MGQGYRLAAHGGIMTILYFAIALGLLVFIHEFGHFLVAKLSGIRVEKFSLGFGPRLIGLTRCGTDYRISLVPLGGYIKMTGEEPDSPETSDSYSSKPIGRRLGVVVAGPFMNLLLALVIMPLVFFIGKAEPKFLSEKPIVIGVTTGSPAADSGLNVGDEILGIDGTSHDRWEGLLNYILLHPETEAEFQLRRNGELFEKKIRIGIRKETRSGFLGIEPYLFIGQEALIDEVAPGTPAAEGGLQKGDRVLAIDGEPIRTWNEMSDKVNEASGKTIRLTIQREKNAILEVPLTPLFDEGNGRWLMGVRKLNSSSGETIIRRYPFVPSIVLGFKEVGKLAGLTIDVLKRLVTFQLSYKSLGGPIRIAQGAAMAAESGLSYFLYFIAFLSLQLSILNILPIPILDGGHVLYLGIEKLRSRPVSMRLRNVADQTGMALLLLLMLLVTLNDIDSVWGLRGLLEKIKGLF